MKPRRIFAVLALLAVIVSACSSFSGQPDLNGTSWVLTQLQGSPVASTSVPTLIFADGQVSGNASCNSFGGSYQHLWGDSLKFGPLMSTLMACLDSSAMEREGVYLGVLGQVAKYRVDNDQLFLYDGDNHLLAEFKKQ